MKIHKPYFHSIKVFNEKTEPVHDVVFILKNNLKEEGIQLETTFDEGLGVYYFDGSIKGDYVLEVSHKDYQSEQEQVVFVEGKRKEIIFILSSDSTHSYFIHGNNRVPYQTGDEEIIAIHFKADISIEDQKELEEKIRNLGFEEIYEPTNDRSLRQFKFTGDQHTFIANQKQITAELENEKGIQDLRIVLDRKGKNLIMLSEEITVKFKSRVSEEQITSFLEKHNLQISRKPPAANIFLLKSPLRTNQELLDLCKDIKFDPLVEVVESNIISSIEPDLVNPIDYLAVEQWDHINLINTPDAWERLQLDPQAGVKGNTAFGNPNIIIGVIDIGIDPTHQDLAANLSDGSGKIVQVFDFASMAPNLNRPNHSHGTSCISAAASHSNTGEGIAGIAGNSHVMAIQVGGGAVQHADIFEWVAGLNPQNGAFPALPANGADVISNSWGTGVSPIPVLVSSAIDRITVYGRNGRGTLIFFSAGNGNGFYETQRSYGTHQRAFAIGASALNNTGRSEIHAPYSNFGSGILISAPSHDQYVGASPFHNPPANYGAFSATHRPNAPNQIAQTQVTAAALPGWAPPNSIPVASTAGFAANNHVIVGPPGNVNTERYSILAVNLANSFLVLNHPWAVAPVAGNNVTLVDGNCPGTNTNRDSLTAAAAAGFTITVATPALYGGGNAVLINPGTANSEAHAIQSVNTITNVVTLMTPLNNPGSHIAGTVVDVGSADYMNNFGGTSYSTPVCAGVAALILAANQALSWVEVKNILTGTARKINVNEVGTLLGGVNIGKWRDVNGQDVFTNAGALISLATPVTTTLTVLDASRTTLTVAPVAGFESGQAIDIGNAEFRVISSVVGNTITLDAPLLNIHPPGTSVEAGRKPHYSAFYGFGRIHAGSAVQEALDSVANFRQLLIRKNLADNGNLATTNIQSPDLWVSNTAMITNTATYRLKRLAVGLDDLSFTQTYTGSQNAEFFIIIDGTGPDTFAWRMNNGLTFASVAITGAPQLLSNGFNIQFGAVAGHRINDNWTIFVDLTEAGLDYTQDAPHENPVVASSRFIHARIHNLVTGPLAAQYKNLDAWVRFYIALSPGKTANAIAQGAGFNSNFFFSSNGNNNDWDDTTAIASITGGAANTYFVGEVEVPADEIEPHDPADPGKGSYIVSIPWNQVDIPPVAIAHSIFVLAHIAPFHGRLNGTGAHNNSCLSYREITFAEFSFMDLARANTLPLQLEVDAFGSSVTRDFSVDVQVHIGNFTTEKLKLEVVRLSDNATEEKAVFHFDGLTWTFEAANPQWTGLTVNAPVLIVGGGAASGNQTQISFQGNFLVAKEHQGVFIRPQIISKHSQAVIGKAEHALDVIQTGEMPTGTDPASLAAPPPPESYAFADMANVTQSAGQAYGPVSGNEANEFRVSSLFTATSSTNAYAITTGIIFLQPGSTPNTVNLILRPFKQSVIGFTPVKYFVYRGLRKADFLDTADDKKVLAEDPSNSEFIKRQYEIHKGQNVATAVFLSKTLGYDPANQNNTDTLDSYFFKNDPDFQLPLAIKGMELGKFFHTGNHEFGIDILLEEGSYKVDLDYVRKDSHVLSVTGMASGSDAQKLLMRLRQEEIVNFIDPAAFYGMHVAQNGTVETRKLLDGTTENRKGQDIYNEVVSKFITRNKIYLDIRSENGNSYNFYGNYKGKAPDPDLGKNIKVGTEFSNSTSHNLVAQTYQTNEWPIVIEERVQNVAGDNNFLFISLRFDDNTDPIMYVEEGSTNSVVAQLSPDFLDPFDLGNFIINAIWTQEVGFDLPNTGVAGTKSNIATVIKLFYTRELPSATAWPDTVLKTESYTDNVFGPVNLNPLWTSDSNIKWMTAQDKKFISFNTWGYMAERGVSIDAFSTADPNAGRAVFFAVASNYYNPPGGFQNTSGVTGGVSSKGTFFEAAAFFQNLKLSFDLLIIAGVKITTLQLTPSTGLAISPNSILLLCISRKELEDLKAESGFSTLYSRYIKPEQVADTVDDTGKAYKKYKLKVQGLDSNGKYKLSAPATDVFVFSVDQFLFFSDKYSKDEPLPTLYSRNAEEHIGGLISTTPLISWEDLYIGKDSKGTLAAIADKAPKIVQDFINAVNTVVNDANAKTNLEAHIDNFPATLLTRMRAFAADGGGNLADDRILYWARNKMKVALQSHEFLLQAFRDRNDLLRRFESISRGYNSINFAPATSGVRKILITGFDPYFLDPKGGMSHNIKNSNVSGAAALALHGQFIQNLASNVAYVQSVVFPVRYSDFDKNGGEGIIEEFFTRFIDPTATDYTPVDLIIVMDKATPHSFMFGRFASKRRGLAKDNEFQHSADIPLIINGDQYYETNLPIEKAVPDAPYPAGQDYYRYYKQTYKYKIKADSSAKEFTKQKREGKDKITNDPEGTDASNLLPTNQLSSDILALQGSFNHYFGNEIFYRLSVLRAKKNNAVKTGLLMLPKIQGSIAEAAGDPKIKNDFDNALTKEVIDELKLIIRDLLI